MLGFRGLLIQEALFADNILTEIEAGKFRVGQNPCCSQSAICKRVYTREFVGIAVNEAHSISNRQVAWLRVDIERAIVANGAA